MTTHYVRVTGSDTTGTGTSINPWKTIDGAIGKAAVVAGDTIIVGNGTYKEVVTLDKDITLQAENEHGAIITGGYGPELFGDSSFLDFSGNPVIANRLPAHTTVNRVTRGGNWLPTSDTCYATLVNITAVGATMDGFIVRDSAARGLSVQGNNVTVRNCHTDFTHGTGLWVGTTGSTLKTGIVIEDCIVTRASMKAFVTDRVPECGTGMAVDSCFIVMGCSSPVIRRCTVAYSWGEGLWLAYKTTGALVEDCLLHTNIHVSLYPNGGGTDSIIRRNTVYFCENHKATLQSCGLNASNNALFGDEEDTTGRRSGPGLQLYDNLFIGGASQAAFEISGSANTGSSWSRGYVLEDAWIAFNTIVSGPNSAYTAFLKSSGNSAIRPGVHTDSLIENNIFVKYPTTATNISVVEVGAGYDDVSFRNNLSSNSFPTAMAGTGNVVSSAQILANPFAAITGVFDHDSAALPDPFNTTFNPYDYGLASGSAGYNMASDGSLINTIDPPVTRDDVGVDAALTNTVNPVYAASFSPSVSWTNLTTGDTVVFDNTSVVSGTTWTSNYWEVEKDSSVIDDAATLDYSYTFATAGTYIVTLTITTPLGTDTDTVTYTVTDAPTGEEQTWSAEIAAGDDDAQQVGTSVNVTGISVAIEAATSLGGFRFDNIPVGPDDTVTAAYLRVRPASTTYDDPDVDLHVQIAADAAAFVASSNNIFDRTLSTAKTQWTATAVGDSYLNTPDFADAFQELIESPGWAAGNAAAVILKGRTAPVLRIRSVEHTSLSPVELHLAYIAAVAAINGLPLFFGMMRKR